MNPQEIHLRLEAPVCFLEFARPEAQNSISRRMIEECHEAFDLCREKEIRVIVIKGSRNVFCSGADFAQLAKGQFDSESEAAELLYRLWMRMTEEAPITICQVQSKATAGGIGFVAASDLVLAEPAATFALPELLFGLFPACVLPFLVRRIGFQKAHYLTLSTLPITAEQAHQWGLVDCCGPDSDELLRRHLIRLGRLSLAAIGRYKQYMRGLNEQARACEALALEANRDIFSDAANRRAIEKYFHKAMFPWEQDRSSN